MRLKPLIEEIHGTLYDAVFKTSPKGNTIVTRRQDMTSVKWSEAQQNQCQRDPCQRSLPGVCLR